MKALPWESNKALYLLLRYICRCQQRETHLGRKVGCLTLMSARHFYPTLNKFGFSGQISIKARNIKVHENPTSCSRAGTCRQNDRWISNFRSYAKEPQNYNPLA